jgi:hypothetical protein
LDYGKFARIFKFLEDFFFGSMETPGSKKFLNRNENIFLGGK